MSDSSPRKLSQHLVDPELRSFVDAFPDEILTMEKLPEVRKRFQEKADQNFVRVVPAHLERKEIRLTSRDGLAEITALMYLNKQGNRPSPAFLHIHGGGLVAGCARAHDRRNLRLCGELGITVLSVDYRLAPENPYPAAMQDCLGALDWLFENAAAVGIDPAAIAVGGDSAGGGLAAGLCQAVRDEGTDSIASQHLVYPMLDHQTGMPEQPTNPLVGEYVWTPQKNQFGWQSYLGPQKPVSPAVPAAAERLNNLPPAWIWVGQLDLFRDESISYANRLMTEGVPTELHVVPGAVHGFSQVTDAALTVRFESEYVDSFRHLLLANIDST
ncbi:alpha/beta hydrolase [Parasphingorhabdus marina]|nr:alpha/beta hydrolase [Parasphingorhabdus marina]